MSKATQSYQERPNHPKRRRDTPAFEQVAGVHGAGFAIEAIMICEHAVMDRLISHLARRRAPGGTIRNRDVRVMLDGSSDGEDEKHVSTGTFVRMFEAILGDLCRELFVDVPDWLRDQVRDRKSADRAFDRAQIQPQWFPRACGRPTTTPPSEGCHSEAQSAESR